MNFEDRDPGDYDHTEVQTKPRDVWHPSHLPAAVPPVARGPSEEGRLALRACLSLVTRPGPAAHRAPCRISSWCDTPEPFRKLIARAAQLDGAVVAKADRELTETEKAAIRAAAQRLKERADALFAL
jgi:hypothetical protein